MDKKKILIADDEIDIRTILEKKLMKEGFTVNSVSTGKDLLDSFKKEQPDLILLDIAMPDLNGYQICDKLREQIDEDKDLPVLFLTGKDLDPKSISQHCEELQVRGFIQKPATFEELLAKIKEVI